MTHGVCVGGVAVLLWSCTVGGRRCGRLVMDIMREVGERAAPLSAPVHITDVLLQLGVLTQQTAASDLQKKTANKCSTRVKWCKEKAGMN